MRRIPLPGRTSFTRIVWERPGRAMSLIASGAPARTILVMTPDCAPRFTFPSRTYDAYAGRGGAGSPATARNVKVSGVESLSNPIVGVSAPTVTDPPNMPASFRKLRRSTPSMIHHPSMRIPQIREVAQVVRVGSDHVRRHRPIRHEVQLDVDHVVRELAPIEEACGARRIEGQYVGEKDTRDARRLGRRVADGRENRDDLVGEAGDILDGLRLVEHSLLFAVHEDRVDCGAAHAVDLEHAAVWLRQESSCPDPNVGVWAQGRVRHLEGHAEHILVREEVGSGELEPVQETEKIEEERVAPAPREEFEVAVCRDGRRGAEGYDCSGEEDLADEVPALGLRPRGQPDLGRLPSSGYARKPDLEGDVRQGVTVRVHLDLVDGTRVVPGGQGQRVNVQDEDRLCRVPRFQKRVDIRNVDARVASWGHEPRGIKMIGHRPSSAGSRKDGKEYFKGCNKGCNNPRAHVGEVKLVYRSSRLSPPPPGASSRSRLRRNVFTAAELAYGSPVFCRFPERQKGKERRRATPHDELPRQPDVDLPFNVIPLSRRAQPQDELLKRGRITGRVLEPGQEVEWLAEVVAMVESSGDRRKVLEANGDMMRVLLENHTPLVLGQLPPFSRLGDRDQGGFRGLRPVEERLDCSEPVVLRPRRIPLVAGHSAERPTDARRLCRDIEYDLYATRRGQGWPANGSHSQDFPFSQLASHERYRDYSGGIRPSVPTWTGRSGRLAHTLERRSTLHNP